MKSNKINPEIKKIIEQHNGTIGAWGPKEIYVEIGDTSFAKDLVQSMRSKGWYLEEEESEDNNMFFHYGIPAKDEIPISNEYRIDPKITKIVTIFCGCLGVLVFISAVYFRWQKGILNTFNDWASIIICAILVAGVLPLIIVASSIFKFRISGQFIELIFLDRKILKRKPIVELESIKYDRGLSVVKLYFKDGSTMGLYFALPHWERAKLQRDLERLVGHSLTEE